MNTYTKLFGSLIHSTVWQESLEVKVVWITMLAMCDKEGEVQASIPGVASAAGVSISAAEAAIQKFLNPDKYSRSPEFEGRRIEAIDGGWMLLNHAKYRDLTSDEQMKAQAAERQRRYRARQKESQKKFDSNVTKRDVTLPKCDSNVIVTHTDTDTDTDTEAVHRSISPATNDSCSSKDSLSSFSKNGVSKSDDGVLFENQKSESPVEKPKKTVKEKKPKAQTNGYNPVEKWIKAISFHKHIQSPKVSGFEIKYLTELGNMYSESEFRAMLEAYGKARREDGKPWRLFDEFYKCHAEWRSKAYVSMPLDTEEGNDDAIEAAFQGKPK